MEDKNTCKMKMNRHICPDCGGRCPDCGGRLISDDVVIATIPTIYTATCSRCGARFESYEPKTVFDDDGEIDAIRKIKVK
jgi:transcription elongation factor Elf1